MLDFAKIAEVLSSSQLIMDLQIWFDSFYSSYIDNIWNNAEVWRYISMLSILLLISYKKKIRFFNTNEEKIEHDRSVFINSDLIMTENFFKEFLIELSINETYQETRYQKVKDFCNYFKYGENQYLNRLVKTSADDFCDYIPDTLFEFLDEHFFEIETEGVYKLYPDLIHDPEFNYGAFQEQLCKMCKQAEILYSEYRLAVKAKLSL